MSDNSVVRDTAETVKGIVEAVPVYEDAIQPAAKEVGKALQTVVKTVHIALAPISAMVWGYEQVKDFVERIVAEKLKDVPPERIVTPPPNVAGPALEALKYTGHDGTLREMYANLLATALDAKTAEQAHPSFVQIIQQMTRDEAVLLERLGSGKPSPLIDVKLVSKDPDEGGFMFARRVSELGGEAGCEHLRLVPAYLDNLQRLGLIEMPDSWYTDDSKYDSLECGTLISDLKKLHGEESDHRVEVQKYLAQLTTLGEQFIKACRPGTNQD